MSYPFKISVNCEQGLFCITVFGIICGLNHNWHNIVVFIETFFLVIGHVSYSSNKAALLMMWYIKEPNLHFDMIPVLLSDYMYY